MIAYIYRPKRQRYGKQSSNRIWRARLKLNGDVKPRDISLGVSDKQVAEQKLRELTRDHERVSRSSISIVHLAPKAKPRGRKSL